jgi:hypothetical protein
VRVTGSSALYGGYWQCIALHGTLSQQSVLVVQPWP